MASEFGPLSERPRQRPPTMRTAPVAREWVTRPVEATGTLLAYTSVRRRFDRRATGEGRETERRRVAVRFEQRSARQIVNAFIVFQISLNGVYQPAMNNNHSRK